MSAGFSTDPLPPIFNGRRYPYELENPMPIPPEDRSAVLELLKEYYDVVDLSTRTFSDASGTTAPPYSEASTETSISDMSFAFSANNGFAQPEPARKKLPDVQRARKALLRKLRACRNDCQKRKVKCKLYHHALRDLLVNGHEPCDEMVIEWAIRLDGDSHSLATISPASARVTSFAAGDDIERSNDVVDQANGVFQLPPIPPMLYASRIGESTASLLDPSDVIPHLPSARENAVVPAVSPPDIYITSKDEFMFLLGSREHMLEPAHYSCNECGEILSLQALILHYDQMHLSFEQLNDPRRMVCPYCDKFYIYSNDSCWTCHVQRGGLVERLYGRRFHNTTTIGLRLASSTVKYGCLAFSSSGNRSNNWYQDQGSASPPQNQRFDYSSNYSSPGSSGGTYYTKLQLVMARFKRSFSSSSILPKRLLCFVYSHRKYAAVLIVAAIVSCLLSYTEHDWILSKVIHLANGVSTISLSNLPFVGVMIASIAFRLHRIVVHGTRASSIRNGWLFRCALNVFNASYGRRRAEWLEPAYELGHSRS